MTTTLWILAVLLMLIGLAGTVLPALPGIPLVFCGVLLAAWIEDFQRIPGWIVGTLAVLAAIGVAVDYAAAALSAQRVGATRAGVVGAALGSVAGVFTGLWGLLFMPLAGAAIGEFVAHRDALRAGKVGVATWVGLLIAAAAKVAIVFAMLGVFIAALLF